MITNHAGVVIFFFITSKPIVQPVKTMFIKTDNIQPTIIANSLRLCGMVKPVCRNNKQIRKNRLQMKATLARNKNPCINNFV